MKTFRGLVGVIGASREQVLAPLLLSPPSALQSKQVAKAYLCTQTELYRILLETLKSGNGEKLLGVLQRGWESLENLVSLLNERSRLKSICSDPEKLNRTNRRIVDMLSPNGQSELPWQHLEDSFSRLLMPESEIKRLDPIHFEGLDTNNDLSNNLIEDYKLTLDAQLIKINQAKYPNKKQASSGFHEFCKYEGSLEEFNTPDELNLRLASSRVFPEESFCQPNGFRLESPDKVKKTCQPTDGPYFEKKGLNPIISVSPPVKSISIIPNNAASIRQESQSLINQASTTSFTSQNLPGHTPHFPLVQIVSSAPKYKSLLTSVPPSQACDPSLSIGPAANSILSKSNSKTILHHPPRRQLTMGDNRPISTQTDLLPSFEVSRVCFLLDLLFRKPQFSFFIRAKSLYKKTLSTLEKDLYHEKQKNERLMMLLGGLRKDGWDSKGWIDSPKAHFRLETEGSKKRFNNLSPKSYLTHTMRTGSLEFNKGVLGVTDNTRSILDKHHKELTQDSSFKFEKSQLDRTLKDSTNIKADRQAALKSSLSNFSDLGNLASLISGDKFTFRNVDNELKKTSTGDYFRPQQHLLGVLSDNPKSTVQHFKNLAKSLGFNKLQPANQMHKENTAPLGVLEMIRNREGMLDRFVPSRSKSKNKFLKNRLMGGNGKENNCNESSSVGGLTFN